MTEYTMPFIYCLSNPAMPELLKIGAVHMNDKTVKDRADELFTTGVPAEFRVELFTEIEDSRGVERKIHAILDSYRVNSSREFFRISPENVQKILAEKMPEISWSNAELVSSNNSSKSTYKRLFDLYTVVLNDANAFVKMMEANEYYEGDSYETKNKQRCNMVLQRLNTINGGLQRFHTAYAEKSPYRAVDNAYMKKELNSIKSDLERFKIDAPSGVRISFGNRH